MNGQKRSFFVAVAALVAGIGLVVLGITSWPTDDEEAIANKLAKLSEVVAVVGEENPLMRMTRLRREFEDLFEEDARVSIPEINQTPRGRRQLAELGSRATVLYRSLSVSFTGQETVIDPQAKTARTKATAKLMGSRGANELRRDERKVQVDWSRSSGDWLITDIRVGPREAE